MPECIIGLVYVYALVRHYSRDDMGVVGWFAEECPAMEMVIWWKIEDSLFRVSLLTTTHCKFPWHWNNATAGC